ncbi:MAG: preprotein translocase subunit YajC [Burkholderiaceae bacterium]
MRVADFDAVPTAIIASLTVAVVVLAVRIFVLVRLRKRHQREMRQETERLRSLVLAYRSMAGSFSPATGEHRAQMEEALADVVLFGTLPQVEKAVACARALAMGEPVDYQPLVDDLRADLREQLGLEPLPATLAVPASGPGRTRLPPWRAGRGAGNGPAGALPAGRDDGLLD